MLEAVRSKFRAFFNQLEQPEQITWQIKLLLMATDLHIGLKRKYNEYYGSKRQLGLRGASESIVRRRSPERRASGQRMIIPGDLELCQRDGRRASAASIQSCPIGKYARLAKRAGLMRPAFSIESQVDERNFLNYSKHFEAYRVLTTVWWLYIVAKYVAIEHRGAWLNDKLGLERPIHCLLLGRFMMNESFSYIISGAVASLLLYWRICLRLLNRPYKLSGLHFLLLDPKELDSLHKQIGAFCDSKLKRKFLLQNQATSCPIEPSIVLDESEALQLKPRERFILDTMCFRVRHQNELIYTLRSSRTPSEHARMRKLVVKLMLLAASMIVIVLALTLTYSLIMLGSDERFLRAYKGCDAHLERLKRSDQLAPRSITLTRTHLIAMSVDLLENLIFWTDGCLIAFCGTGTIFILNYDLMNYWKRISAKLERMQTWTRVSWYATSSIGGDQKEATRRELRARTERATHQTQAEIFDFFAQVREVDTFISDELNLVTFAWLLLTSGLIYTTQIKAIDRLPTDVILFLLLLAATVFISWLGLLTLQRLSSKSYVTICSLMAYDKTGHWQGFWTIMDLYQRKKNCYTWLHQYSFEPTTSLKIIGYSFSGFFLIVSLFRNQKDDCCSMQLECSDTQGANSARR